MEQFSKQYRDIVVLVGILTLVRLSQSQNAPSPINLRDTGVFIEVNFDLQKAGLSLCAIDLEVLLDAVNVLLVLRGLFEVLDDIVNVND